MNPIYRADFPVTVHRDQDQVNPLYGALEKGCQYIEFDVHLEGESLLVGHDAGSSDQTLESVYLKPLQELDRLGSLDGEFTLIVDVKTKAEETFAAIQETLAKYGSMLTSYDEGTGLVKRHVRVIISGNRDKGAIAEARPRLAFYDGRIEDFSSPIDPCFMPIVSEKWGKIFQRRTGSWLPAFEFIYRWLPSWLNDSSIAEGPIKDAVDAAQKAGVVFRPWAMPEDEHTWHLLAQFKERGFVYNTDIPDSLVHFLKSEDSLK
jgi:hypothetical protein